jgi:holo-[acyl-carrier protein] synthase
MILGTGVDVVDVERIRRVILRWGDKFLARMLTEDEKEYCYRHTDVSPFVASRIAAKESLFKAIGTGLVRGMTWREVEVVRDAKGNPSLAVHGVTLEKVQELGAKHVHVSMSHSEHIAQAVVILES